MRTISTVIIKPTKACNADCSYCCAPPDGAPKWDIDAFRSVFDALAPKLHPTATFIWHGGEPMLLGPAFYEQAWEYARSRMPLVRFSLQSNLLSYSARWRPVFENIFKGSISTSWDPDETARTYKGNAELYAKLFASRIDRVLNDGWQPKIISTFDEETMPMAHKVYDLAMERARNGLIHDIRLNYRYPAGRVAETGPAILPRTYGQTLIEIYDRWIKDEPDFLVTPLDQMLMAVAGGELARCPWTSNCTGKIVAIEPNFDVHNCGEFADLDDGAFAFGNLIEDGIEACLSSANARKLAARRIKHPESCKSCVHFEECEGGCMRDSALFERGLYGKFYYCESWQMVFSRIKETIVDRSAAGALQRLGFDPEVIRSSVISRTAHSLSKNGGGLNGPTPALLEHAAVTEVAQ